VLDEPNSNLDNEGDVALTEALLKVRARGGIVVVVAHRPSALAALDQLLVMAAGKQMSFGPKDETLSKFTRAPAQVTPLRTVRAGGVQGEV
jgi:ATP-binding cassette subfamily C protein